MSAGVPDVCSGEQAAMIIAAFTGVLYLTVIAAIWLIGGSGIWLNGS